MINAGLSKYRFHERLFASHHRPTINSTVVAKMSELDLYALEGRQQQSTDTFSTNLLQRIAVTLGDPVPEDGDELPALWHWCFFQEPVGEADLGGDGHPVRGGLIQPPAGCNRMWAGGRLDFLQPLRVGKQSLRTSTVVKVSEKSGRTGKLLFVTLRHDYSQDGVLCIREEQDVVYREPTPPKLEGGAAVPRGDWSEAVVPSPTLLFRYSAVTFNGHRIHYDSPYATFLEGYPGLVVHGPLIATLNLRAFQRANPLGRLKRFAYRGVRPLFVPTPFVVGGRLTEPGRAELWAGDEHGLAQSAEVDFD